MKEESIGKVKERLRKLEQGICLNEECEIHEKRINVEIEEDLQIQKDILNELKSINTKQNTVGNIIKFWFILTLINIVLSIYAVIKFWSLLS